MDSAYYETRASTCDEQGSSHQNGDMSDNIITRGETTDIDEADGEVCAEMIQSIHRQFESWQSIPSTGHPQSYNMEKPYVLIINNIKFQKRLEPRNGATADMLHIKQFFCTRLQIPVESVVLRENLTKEDMETELLCASTNKALGSRYDSLICFILSHGSKDGVLGVDDAALPVDDILDIFKGDNCPGLISKPKLFFIQACRGDKTDKGSVMPSGSDIATDNDKIEKNDKTEERRLKIPKDADILVAYSTTKDHAALRSFSTTQHGKTIGSWFIYNLIRVFWHFWDSEDVMSMMLKVNNEVSRMHTGNDPVIGLKQVSCQLSMLRYKLYFGNNRKCGKAKNLLLRTRSKSREHPSMN